MAWLGVVLTEATQQGFHVMGNFQLVGGYLMPPRINGVCVTQLTPILV